jgi:hypothetical protein
MAVWFAPEPICCMFFASAKKQDLYDLRSFSNGPNLRENSIIIRFSVSDMFRVGQTLSID